MKRAELAGLRGGVGHAIAAGLVYRSACVNGLLVSQLSLTVCSIQGKTHIYTFRVYILYPLFGGQMAERLGRRAINQKVAGLILGRAK